MGRIKTTYVKRRSKELIKLYGDKISPDFSQNTKIIGQYVHVHSKKLRNILTGYVTRLKRREH